MIVVLDTNALYGDVYAEKQWATTLFAAADAQEGLDVWVPSVVVEELVRQFPERLTELIREVRALRQDAFALGWNMPPLPDFEAEVSAYRKKVEKRFTAAGVRIAPPPKEAGLIAEWVAQRRKPIPADGSGAVDAQIWLTVAEAASKDEVAFISSNSQDFCDPDDRSALHEVLLGDLDSWSIPARIEVFPRILEFNEQHIEPSLQATSQAKKLLAEDVTQGQLVREIESAISWFPLEAEDWDLGVSHIEEATLAAFDVGALRLVRADPGPRGLSLTLEAYGTATLDLGLYRPDAYELDADSPVVVDDWDWNEWNVSAHAEIVGALLLEVLSADAVFSVSVDELQQVNADEVLALLESWTEREGNAALEVVAESFDVAGEQKAVAVNPREVEKFYFKDGALYLRARFSIDYANPVDEEDRELSAENVAEHVLDLRVEEPNLEDCESGEITWVGQAFPD